MSSSINTTVKKIWSKLANKEYRDSFVASNIANTVSSQIFALRDQRGWTQKQLAQCAGMAQSRIPTLEDPNLENFEIGTLKRIASAFDVALVVRFVPFSELTLWTAELSEEKLVVPDFSNDRLPQSTSGSAGLSSIQYTQGSFGLLGFTALQTSHHYPDFGARGVSAQMTTTNINKTGSNTPVALNTNVPLAMTVNRVTSTKSASDV